MKMTNIDRAAKPQEKYNFKFDNDVNLPFIPIIKYKNEDISLSPLDPEILEA